LQTLRIHEISSNLNSDINITDFCIAVKQMTNANGEKCFTNLTEFIFYALSLPVSNADVFLVWQ